MPPNEDESANVSERAANHMRNLGLPLYDIQGLMRVILDSMGALKIRLEEEVHVEPHLLSIFCETVKMFSDHFSGFDPIDNESALKFLLQAFPDDSKRKDGRSWLPVHLAAAIHNVNPEVIEAVVEERPLQLIKGHLHDEGSTAAADQPAAISQDIYSNAPLACKGLPPLHLIASLRHPHLQSIKMLIDKCPIALQISDHRGYLPLHYCAYNTRSLEALSMVLRRYPDAAFEATKKGKLPFQLASYNKYTIIMDVLLDANPAAIDAIDYNGNTPLHDAAKSLNFEGCKKILSYKPALNRVRNFNEAMPIHKAFFFIAKSDRRLQSRQLDTVKALLQVNPELAALPDENNMLLLHLAVFHRSCIEVVEYVFNIYPTAAVVKDRYDQLPINYVTDDVAVKTLLLRTAKPLARAGITDSFSRFTMS